MDLQITHFENNFIQKKRRSKKVCLSKHKFRNFQMMFVSFNSNTTGTTSGSGIAYPGFDINFLTNLSIRASAILILLARNSKLLALILKCHICM